MTPEEKKERQKINRRKWYLKHRDRVLIEQQEYSKRKPPTPEQKERMKVYRKEWAAKNKEHLDNLHKIWYKENKDRVLKQNRANYLKRVYGLTVDEYNQMFVDQDHRCWICLKHNDDTKGLHVDHCHTTGKVRGLLCGTCNRMLGMVKDDPEILRKGIEYLCQPT